MPITQCSLPNGKQGYKWGSKGTCYPSRAGAVAQAVAVYASGWKEKTKKLLKVKQTLYVKRNVLNAEEIVSWAKGQGFETTLPPEDMHVTIAFSKDKVDWSLLTPKTDEPAMFTGDRTVELLGDKGAVVLKFSSPSLLARWGQIRSAGASWDWDGYTPHVTITYDKPDKLDISKVAPFGGAIVLGPEIFASVDDDWVEKLVEKANPYHDPETGKFTTKENAVQTDMVKQFAWLTNRAKQRNISTVDDLVSQHPQLFSQLAELWRKNHPNFGAIMKGYTHIFKFNPYHEPAGSSKGGQFAKKPSGSSISGGVEAGVRVDRVTDTKEFKAWFGESKIVDEDGDPLVLYHGTTGDFEEFDLSKANPESDFGAGIYLTNAVADVGTNYAGEGPDLTNRLELERENIERELEDSDGDVTPELIDRLARERLSVVHGGAVLPVYVRMETPFVVGGDRETFLDYEQDYDEESEEYSEPKGKLVDFVENLREAASRYDGGEVEPVIETLLQEAFDYGGIKSSDLGKIIRSDEKFGYYQDYDSPRGSLISNEIYRKALELSGFDGVMDNTVDVKFGSSRRVGASMVGVQPDTTHYIVFSPNQIKSAIGNVGAFDPKDKRITKVEVEVQKAERILKPFVSFKKGIDTKVKGNLQMISSLHTSRLSGYGFTAEANALGVDTYAISEQLDNRICPVCEVMHGKTFQVADARRLLDTALRVEDPEDLKTIQPWPRQDKASVDRLRGMSTSELVSNKWNVPPFHPLCRGLLVHVDNVPSIQDTPSYVEAFGRGNPQILPVTEEQVKNSIENLGIKLPASRNARKELIEVYTKVLGTTPGELFTKLSGTSLASLTTMSLNYDPVFGAGFELRGRMQGASKPARLNAAINAAGNGYIDFVSVHPEDQGVGRKLITSFVDLVKDSGGSTIGLLANIDVGAYAWAKYGFLPVSNAAWLGLKNRIRSTYERVVEGGSIKSLVSPQTARVIDQILDSDDPRLIRVLSDLSEPINGRKVGALLLTGNSWEAVLDLFDTESMNRYRNYIGAQ